MVNRMPWDAENAHPGKNITSPLSNAVRGASLTAVRQWAGLAQW
jgi:hypothetical protein